MVIRKSVMPNSINRFKKILVAVDLADDLRFVSGTLPTPTEEAIRQAEWVAELSGAEIVFFYVLPRRGTELHVLHSIEYPNPASDAVEDRRKLEVENEIREQLLGLGFDDAKAHIQVEIGYAEEAFLSYIEQHNIELIVMGTISRKGITGMLIGNTAEKLLPFLSCSVLAVKPANFESPVLLTNDEFEDELA